MAPKEIVNASKGGDKNTQEGSTQEEGRDRVGTEVEKKSPRITSNAASSKRKETHERGSKRRSGSEEAFRTSRNEWMGKNGPCKT